MFFLNNSHTVPKKDRSFVAQHLHFSRETLFRDLTISEPSADSINVIFYKYPLCVRHLLWNGSLLAENSKFRGYILFPSPITAEVGFLSFFLLDL